MRQYISPDGPGDLATLDDFLAWDRTPPECMQLSDLDGFLAGIVAGPELIPPSVWLRMIWHDDEPVYADLAEAQTILGIIMHRYNEINRRIDLRPGAYQPILVEQDDGEIDASDWALGFIQALALCQDAWAPLVCEPVAGALITPIMLLASTTDKANLPLDEDERLPDAEMAKLRSEAGPLLSLCVSGMRGCFRAQRSPARRKPKGRTQAKRR